MTSSEILNWAPARVLLLNAVLGVRNAAALGSPAAFAVALWRKRDRHGATVPLWWMAQNCWNVSVYVRDARTQELPLVGGGEHDWALLLGRFGWLERDQVLGGAIYLVGVVLYAVAIVGGWVFLSSGKLARAEVIERSRV